MNSSYIEPDREDGSDDDGAISLNAIKNKYNKANSKYFRLDDLSVSKYYKMNE